MGGNRFQGVSTLCLSIVCSLQLDDLWPLTTAIHITYGPFYHSDQSKKQINTRFVRFGPHAVCLYWYPQEIELTLEIPYFLADTSTDCSKSNKLRVKSKIIIFQPSLLRFFPFVGLCLFSLTLFGG